LWTGARALALILSCACAQARDPAPPPAPETPTESVVITARELPVKNLIDRKVYSLTTDVQATFGTLSDVLGAIPSVDVDPDGIVSLRGDSNVLILVDGKPSPLFSGSKAGDNLQSFPASDIERIEVLTTPPPEFKTEGAAGVINIITRKKHPQGLAGSLQASLGTVCRRRGCELPLRTTEPCHERGFPPRLPRAFARVGRAYALHRTGAAAR